MEVRLSAKVGDTEVGVGVLILDMSKLLQAIQCISISTPSSFNGHISHLHSPVTISTDLLPKVEKQNSEEIEDSVEIVAAPDLPLLTPNMSNMGLVVEVQSSSNVNEYEDLDIS